MAWLAMLLQSAATTAPSPSAGDDIDVVASRQRCGVAIADRLLSSKEFDRRSVDWTNGVPVRAIVPTGADDRCFARFMFRLANKGVTRAELIDR